MIMIFGAANFIFSNCEIWFFGVVSFVRNFETYLEFLCYQKHPIQKRLWKVYTHQKKPRFTKETRKSSIYRHISLLNDNQPPMAKLNVTSKDGLDRFLSKAKQSDTYIAGILNPAAADSKKSKNKKIFILVLKSVAVGFTSSHCLSHLYYSSDKPSDRPPFSTSITATRYK